MKKGIINVQQVPCRMTYSVSWEWGREGREARPSLPHNTAILVILKGTCWLIQRIAMVS